MYAFLWNMLFPPKCVSCGIPGKHLCESCFSRIEFLEEQYCPACHEPSVLGYKAHGCTKRSWIDMLIGVAWYRGVVRDVITKFKYGRALRALESDLQRIVRLSVRPDLFDEDFVVIPVPLHQHRLKVRGFNQSEILGRILSEHLGLAMDANLLKRVVNTPKQSRRTTKKERRRNIKDAFALTASCDYDKVLLVDDVYTSGSTLEECAKTIKKGSPNTFVAAFTLARG